MQLAGADLLRCSHDESAVRHLGAKALTKCFAVILLGMLAWGTAYAAAPEPAPTQAVPTVTAPTATEAALKAELQVMRDFTQHILSTVYWSLATVALVLLAMIGFGWYQNVKAYERDKAAMRDEILGSMKTELSEIEKRLTELVTSKYSALETRTQASILKLDDNTATLFETADKRTRLLEINTALQAYRQTHREPTSLTDFLELIHTIRRHADALDAEQLGLACKGVVRLLEQRPELGTRFRAELIELSALLPAECATQKKLLDDLLATLPIRAGGFGSGAKK